MLRATCSGRAGNVNMQFFERRERLLFQTFIQSLCNSITKRYIISIFINLISSLFNIIFYIIFSQIGY